MNEEPINSLISHLLTNTLQCSHASARSRDIGQNGCFQFANVNVDSMRYFQITDFTHIHRMSNPIDYIRSVYQNLGRDTRLMTLPQDGTPLHLSMIEYFTRFRNDILQRAKLTCFEELTVFHLL